MDSLVDTLLSLPLEAQAIGGVTLFIVVMTIARLLRSTRRPSEAATPPPSRSIDPVLLSDNAPPRPMPGAALDFTSQETIIPGTVKVPGPIEQIDLLAPERDSVPTLERADARTLDAARRRIEIVASRTKGAGQTDNLTAIRGLSPTHARALERLGLCSFEQLGALTPDDLQAISVLLACPVEQIRSDDWVGQARQRR